MTPLRAAKKMAEGFEGAVVLTQDSPGHCTLAAKSACTVGFVREYFQSGEMPPRNTTCGVEEVPFGPTPGEDLRVSVLEKEDRELSEDLAEMQAALLSSGGSMMGSGINGGRDMAWFS